MVLAAEAAPKSRKKADAHAATPAPTPEQVAAATTPPAQGQSGPEASAPKSEGDAPGTQNSTTPASPAAKESTTAPAVDPNVPSIEKVREAVFAYMGKQGEKVGASPKTIALIQKYNAKLVTDIAPERRAEFIAECNKP